VLILPFPKDSGLKRQQLFQRLQVEHEFDVVILGGGINGACLYDTLCRQGYKVLLLDKSDFSAGTSQSSGMMIWGGLLYLRNLDFSNVFELSSGRDQIIRQKTNWVSPERMRYLASAGTGRSKWWVQSGFVVLLDDGIMSQTVSSIRKFF
jgi:glycerol-3-phosphate dehydrogenase